MNPEIRKPAELSLGHCRPFPLLDSGIQGSGWGEERDLVKLTLFSVSSQMRKLRP